MILIRKAKTLYKLIIYKNWEVLLNRLPLLRFLLNFTNHLPHPNNYKAILLGGHGLGLNSLSYYLNRANIKTMPITNNPFIFWSDLKCILLDDINTKTTNKILSKLNHKVIVYQIIRDPILTIKSVINVLIINHISVLSNKNDVYNLLLRTLKNDNFMIFHFSSLNALISHITLNKIYLTMNDLNSENFFTTLDAINKKIDIRGGAAARNR